MRIDGNTFLRFRREGRRANVFEKAMGYWAPELKTLVTPLIDGERSARGHIDAPIIIDVPPSLEGNYTGTQDSALYS